jgi:arsenical-resistance protein 2
METSRKPTPAWAQSYPEPRSRPSSMSPDTLRELITTKAPAIDFIIVDVRRADVDVRFPDSHEYLCVGLLIIVIIYDQAVIPGAINLPAQTFYPLLLPTLSTLLSSIPIVVFHCSSSLGRATRCAGWLGDVLPPDSACKVFILEGGMKAWRARFEEDRKMVMVMPLEGGESVGTGAGAGV